MNKLNVNFSFEGFRIVRNHPAVIPIWGIVTLIGMGAALAAFLSLSWPSIQELIKDGMVDPESDPTRFLRLIGEFVGPYLVMVLIMLAVQAVLACATFRATFGGTSKGFGFIRLGGDEVRMFLVMLVMNLLLLVINIATSLVGAIIGGILGAVVGAENGKNLGELIAFVMQIFFVIRLSLAYSQSFYEKKFNLFGSWALTGPNFGTLLLGYVIMVVLAIVVSVLCLVIFFVIAAIGLGSNAEMLTQFGNDPSPADILRLATVLAPWLLGYFAFVSLLVSPLLSAIFTGGPAAAYKQITGAVRQAENIF